VVVHLFPIRSPQRVYTFCSAGWFDQCACTLLTDTPQKVAHLLLYHLYYSMLKNFSLFSNFTAQAKEDKGFRKETQSFSLRNKEVFAKKDKVFLIS
jgi:hypothetical protein